MLILTYFSGKVKNIINFIKSCIKTPVVINHTSYLNYAYYNMRSR
ncbi:hypothetical protein GXM_06498 [Nostoc sphaeroides CCNUC1]|uniref:Uncharacterized protein n=1 Tax=Nostoc sphaeroides CCNUC1 TaxID=2653204 RepID=A0A5P8W8L4_9NOSO|nr:hypothetical protein GXM_06498 [Nostoc sphaeroides CCNUC1]